MFSKTRAFRFTTDHGTIRTDRFAIGNTGVSISRVVSTGHEIELTELENASIILPTVGSIDVRVGDKEFSASPSEAIVLRPNHRTTRVIRDAHFAYEAFVVMLSPDLFPGAGAGLLDRTVAPSRTMDALIAHLKLVFAPIRERLTDVGPSTAEYITDRVVAMLSLSRTPDHSAMRGSARVQSLAEEFIRENFSHPLTISEIAASAGVSPRRLQLVFRSVAGITPHRALNLVRMEAAHAILTDKDDDRRVTEIALECGFTHLSRFAAAYRAQYGYLPSRSPRV